MLKLPYPKALQGLRPTISLQYRSNPLWTMEIFGSIDGSLDQCIISERQSAAEGSSREISWKTLNINYVHGEWVSVPFLPTLAWVLVFLDAPLDIHHVHLVFVFHDTLIFVETNLAVNVVVSANDVSVYWNIVIYE